MNHQNVKPMSETPDPGQCREAFDQAQQELDEVRDILGSLQQELDAYSYASEISHAEGNEVIERNYRQKADMIAARRSQYLSRLDQVKTRFAECRAQLVASMQKRQGPTLEEIFQAEAPEEERIACPTSRQVAGKST